MTQELEKKMLNAANANAFDIDCGDLNTNRDIFIDGITWFVNAIWHDASEKPEWHSLIIVERYLEFEVITYLDGTYWDDVLRWCYLEDILPTKKGGSKWR